MAVIDIKISPQLEKRGLLVQMTAYVKDLLVCRCNFLHRRREKLYVSPNRDVGRFVRRDNLFQRRPK